MNLVLELVKSFLVVKAPVLSGMCRWEMGENCILQQMSLTQKSPGFYIGISR